VCQGYARLALFVFLLLDAVVLANLVPNQAATGTDACTYYGSNGTANEGAGRSSACSRSADDLGLGVVLCVLGFLLGLGICVALLRKDGEGRKYSCKGEGCGGVSEIHGVGLLSPIASFRCEWMACAPGRFSFLSG
jgi:hypothetical protein